VGVADLVERLRDASMETMLVMSTRKFGDSEASALCNQALATNTTLRHFLASGHKLSESGATCFAEALRKNKTLETIDIGDSTFGDDGLRGLCLYNLNTTLRVLNLEFKGLGARSGDIFKRTLPLTNLVELNLSRNDLDDETIKQLSAGITSNVAKSLLKLDLRKNSFGPEGFTALCLALRNSNVKTLRISDNSKLGPKSMESVCSSMILLSLGELEMNECNIGDEGAILLGEALMNVKKDGRISHLEIGANNITHKGFESIARGASLCTSLIVLRAHENVIGSHGFDALSISFAEMSPGRTFSFIDLSRNGIVVPLDASKIILAKSLRDMLLAKRVSRLSLMGNTLGDDLLYEIANVLENDDILHRLELNGVGMTPSAASYFLGKLHKNRTLRLLEIGGNDIGTEGEEAISLLHENNRNIDVARDKGNV
jgi:Ran GTPase-activating protein (RanGAP) involved in mRNA processing and transport